MKLGYELTIEQSQKLVMTPQIIQAINILQLNTFDLLEYVQRELIENPVLEEKTDFEAELAHADCFKVADAIAEDEYNCRSYREWQTDSDADADDMSIEGFVAEEETLQDFLMDQLRLSNLDADRKKVGVYVIYGIDDDGYLNISPEDISVTCNAGLDVVEEVIRLIQHFDPVGVAARSIQECLLIQMQSKNLLTDDAKIIIEEMLEDVAANRLKKIAHTLDKDPAYVSSIIDEIRNLNPKPGMSFMSGEDRPKYIIPDIIVDKSGEGYDVSFNESGSPHLRLSSYYSRLSRSVEKNSETETYLRDRINSAIWLIKSIEQRRQTVYNVASAIVEYQIDFLDNGIKKLRPLTMKVIADETGMHESTVSRAIKGKYMQTPQGIFSMRYFFDSGVSSNEGDGVSASSVKSIISEIIEKEDPRKPLSDTRIVERLKNNGIDISRRTVAKYREAMGIRSSSGRRRF